MIMPVMSDDLHAPMRLDSSWDQRMLAASNAEVCAKCGASIAAGDPVWIDTYRYYLKAATCAECARRPWDEPELVGRCDGGCGHEVHVRERLDRLRLFCCRRCEIRFYTLQRKNERARRRRRHCAVCGGMFEPRRAGARTCGSACRQKAYRVRKRTADAGEGADPVAPTLAQETFLGWRVPRIADPTTRSPPVDTCPQPATVTAPQPGNSVDTCPQPVSVTATAGNTIDARVKGQKRRDLIAAYVSAYTGQRRSGRTYEKAKAVVKAAEADPERFGEIAEAMGRIGGVDRAWRNLQKAQYQMIRAMIFESRSDGG
jgi:hypothetical protein